MATQVLRVEKPTPRSGLTWAMRKRHGVTIRPMKDRRLKRQNRRSWTREEQA